MAKPDNLSEEEWEAELEARSREKLLARHRARIAREGAEVVENQPVKGTTCSYRTWRKPSNRWSYSPCGDPAVIELRFATRVNPDGVDMPLCKGCVARLVKHLVGTLETL